MLCSNASLSGYPERFAPWHARRAFTLVELMVVMAIIAMLVGLLTMTVRDGLERAKSTRCRNNLRQYGIAIGKYKSDCDGYFMQNPPGGNSRMGGTKALPSVGDDPESIQAEGSDGYRVSMYQDNLRGSKSNAMAFGWGAGYSPEFIQNYVMIGSAGEVTHCPLIDRDIFETNSPNFKGLKSETVGSTTFYTEDSAGAMSSYAMSDRDLYLENRPNEGVAAFIDWNAPYGWGSAIGNIDANGVWQMDVESVGEGVREAYREMGCDSSCTADKGAKAYRTEIGYHHRSGKNHIANYVAVDGHVGSIASNAPYADFSKLFRGY